MNMAFETPWALAGLVLMLLPLLRPGMAVTPYPWLAILPNDAWSTLVAVAVKVLGMLAIALLFLALSGVYRQEQSIERIGHGAHIVLLLDRSQSMDTNFAGKAPSGAEQSKADAARRLLTEFVDTRSHDRIGIAEYSTSPLFVLPLTENKAAIHAAIAATATPALAYTNISKGLGMALSFFENQSLQGSRILLLVSDGAAVIDPDSEAALRTLFKKQQVRVYWLFLRTANSPGIFAEPEDSRDDNAQAMPERYLHLFLSSLHIPYQAYEVENPDALQKAIADVNRLEQLPLHYQETMPRQDLSGFCYGGLTMVIVLLLIVKLFEVRR